MAYLSVWASILGQPLNPGPILTAIGGQIVITELNQFSKSSLQFAAADERVILAMQPYTLLEVVQEGVGTLMSGYVLNPRQQITQQDAHTITLDLDPLTVECTWRRLHRGWQAVNMLGVVVNRLGTFTPGWTGVFEDLGGPTDITISSTLNDMTPLEGFLAVATQYDQFARQGVDATGAPTRLLEMGQFARPPAVWLTGANGGNPDAMVNNDLIRLVATVDRQPNDVSSLVNVCTPFGGGSSTDTVVTLERLWRIINDPTYPNYGKYGAVAGSVFPEYDPAYPISDPDNPPTGTATYIMPDGSIVTATATNTVAQILAAGGQLSQGAVGTRYFTVDGHSDYIMYDRISYTDPRFTHKEGQFIDSGLTYTDPSPANQELTQRALYVETVTNFKRFAHPHHVFTCTTNDATSRPTLAGDLITVDYQRVSVNEVGAVVEMDVTEDLKVMSVMRTFPQNDDPPFDTYTLSNLGRFDQTDAAGQVNTAQQMVNLQINQATSLAPFPIFARDNVDALHPLVANFSIPKQLFRWQQCTFRVDFLPYAATSETAQNKPGDTIYITNASGSNITAAVPHGDHSLTGQFQSQKAPIPALPEHVHQIDIHTGGNTAPTASTPYVYIDVLAGQLKGNGGASAIFSTRNGFATQPDISPTNHDHTTPVNQAPVTVAPNLTAPLPVHTHPLDQRIPDGPTAPFCDVLINGQAISSGVALRSGTRKADGTFAGSFEIEDLSTMLNSMTGDIEVQIYPGTGAGNPFGVGKFVLSGTWYGEFGGLASTVHAP